MSDSKTAKKIEVVPCPHFGHSGRFSVKVDGSYQLDEPMSIDKSNGKMRPKKIYCGTEAEAQAKAQQLANEEASKRQDELNAHFALTPAAVQPTETRPPQPAASVVAQREQEFDFEMQIQEDGSLSIRQVEPAKVDAHHFAELVRNRLAQRTEGEGQHGK